MIMCANIGGVLWRELCRKAIGIIAHNSSSDFKSDAVQQSGDAESGVRIRAGHVRNQIIASLNEVCVSIRPRAYGNSRARYGGHVATVLQPRECVPGDPGRTRVAINLGSDQVRL